MSDFHVADLASAAVDSRKTHLLPPFVSLSFSPPAMVVFPLVFIVLSLSLLVCAADLYKVLQGQTEVLQHRAPRLLITPSFGLR